MDKPVRAIDIHRAIKVILGINYRFHFLDAEISPESTAWYLALQFRNDSNRNWVPRIIIFYPAVQKVAVFERFGDNPLLFNAATIVAMADTRAQSPTPPPVA